MTKSPEGPDVNNPSVVDVAYRALGLTVDELRIERDEAQRKLDRLRADVREYITFLQEYPDETYPQLPAAEVIAQLETILDFDSPGEDATA